MAEKKRGLSDRQLRFCEEYVVDNNGGAAAVRAGYSESSSRVTAHTLLHKEECQAEIQRLRDEHSSRTNLSVEYIITHLMSEATDKVDGTSSSRVAALDKLAKYKGMYTERVEMKSDQNITMIERVIVDPKNREQ